MTIAERLRELIGKATKGPWRPGRSDMTSYDASGDPFKNVYADDPRGGLHHITGETLPYTVARGEGEECHENARLITALANVADQIVHVLDRSKFRLEHRCRECRYDMRYTKKHGRDCAIGALETALSKELSDGSA